MLLRTIASFELAEPVGAIERIEQGVDVLVGERGSDELLRCIVLLDEPGYSKSLVPRAS